MVSFVLLAVLAAPPDPNLDIFLNHVEQQTQRAIDESPHVIAEFQEAIRNSDGAARRTLLAEFRIYERRIKEFQAAKAVVIPLMSFDRRPGEIGRLPNPVRLVEKAGRDCIVEVSWNDARENVASPRQPEAEKVNRTARLFVKDFPATPLQLGQEFDIAVICVATGQEVRGGQVVTVVNQLGISETKIPQLIRQRRRGAREF